MRHQHIIRVLGLIIVVPFTVFMHIMVIIACLFFGDLKRHDILNIPQEILDIIEHYLATGELG